MRLEVFYNTTKITERVENYLDDAYDVALFTKATDFFYVGHYKRLNALYIECGQDTPPLRNKLKVESWNGAAWTEVAGLRDDSRGFERSGFVIWERDTDKEVEQTYQAQKGFFYRLSVIDEDIPNLRVKGLNLVLADDRDLMAEFPSLMSYLPENLSSFIGFHQAARDELIADLRNYGKTVSKNKNLVKKLDQFDLLDFEEFRQAARFKALEKIFFWLSDQTGDRYSQRKAEYASKYGHAKQIAFLSIDQNDDGVTEPHEQNQGLNSVRIIRE